MTQYTTSEPTQEIPYGYCHCGCGEKTNISRHNDLRDGAVKGKPMRYISGHNRRADFVVRFLSYVDKSLPLLCWNWTGGKNKYGYGRINFHGRILAAHRVSYELFVGPFPEHLRVCHSCDNPACVNPSHLFLGTDADNVCDCISKGRNCRGERVASAKLTEQQVLDIRAKYANGLALQRELASEYGVSRMQISDIVCGKAWKHL